MSELPPPSAWLLASADRLADPILDLACGRGRHARALAARGRCVVGVDRNGGSLRALAATPRVLPVQADLELGHALPVAPERFGSVLVFRYLHRPLCPAIAACLRPGGRLVYETFTREQRAFGHGPRRREFLLEPGELPLLFPGLRIESFEEVVTPGERPEALARLIARAPG